MVSLGKKSLLDSDGVNGVFGGRAVEFLVFVETI